MTNLAKLRVGLPAARQAIFDVLRLELDCAVHLFSRPPGRSTSAKPLVELAVYGATGVPDLFELRLLVTCGGDIHRAEHLLDDTIQAVEDALPASVNPPEWAVAYDQDAKHWRAEGRSLAFR